MKALQKFTQEYLDQCSQMKPEQIARFLEDFRLLHGANKKPESQLISMRVPVPLLEVFKKRCQLSSIPYQTQIKALMQEWISR